MLVCAVPTGFAYIAATLPLADHTQHPRALSQNGTSSLVPNLYIFSCLATLFRVSMPQSVYPCGECTFDAGTVAPGTDRCARAQLYDSSPLESIVQLDLSSLFHQKRHNGPSNSTDTSVCYGQPSPYCPLWSLQRY